MEDPCSNDRERGAVTRTCGVIGLGALGEAVAARLLDTGYRLAVYDLDPSRSAAFEAEQVEVCDSPRSVAERTPISVVAVPHPANVMEVVSGASGIASTPGSGTVINISTIDPDTARAAARDCQRHGIGYLDAPVGRTTWHARRGELLVMVSGDETLAQTTDVQHLLEVLGQVEWISDRVGDATVVKLLNNMVSGSILALMAETYVLAKKSDIDPRMLAKVLGQTAAANAFLQEPDLSRILEQEFTPGFSVRLQQKDLRLAVEHAGRVHAPTFYGALSHQLYGVAGSLGYETAHIAAVIRAFEVLAGQ